MYVMSKGENYDEFVEKFKPKKTTDDCYTPEIVYEAIKNYVNDNIFPLDGYNIVRPFYPDGDYENYDYKEDDVVLDNPPFSILSKIIDFYIERKIKYWLFAPHLTLFQYKKRPCTMVVADSSITYANGANVNTDFVTNLYDNEIIVRCDGKLHEVIREANERNLNKTVFPKYSYPDSVISAALIGKIANKGLTFEIKRKHTFPIPQLDVQKNAKKTIFGGGLLLSSEAERLVRRKAEEARRKAEEEAQSDYIFELSEREKEIIKRLDNL